MAVKTYDFFKTPEQNKAVVKPVVPDYQAILKSTPVVTPAPAPTTNFQALSNAVTKPVTTNATIPDYNSITNRNVPTTNYNMTPGVTPKPVTNNNYTGPTVVPTEVIPKVNVNPEMESLKAEIKTLKDMFNNNIPQYKPYNKQLDPQIMSLMNSYKDRLNTPYQFDANNPALKQAQEQAMQFARRDMAKRGMVFSDYSLQKQQESAQQLLPQYYQLGMNQYNQQTQDMGNVINTLRNIDQTGYNRYNDAYNYDVAKNQGNFNQDLTSAPLKGQYNGQNTVANEQLIRENKIQDEKKIEDQEKAEFGVILTPQARELRQQYLQIPIEDKQRLMQYQNDYGATINAMQSTDPSNPDLPKLLAMRANKIFSNPQLMEQYGGQYAMESTAIANNAIAQEQTKLMNKFELLKADLTNQKYKNEIAQIQAEVEKIDSETKYKNTQTIAEEFKALQERTKLIALPTQLQQEINKTISEISANYSRGRASEANATQSYASAQESLSGIGVNQARIGLIGEQANTEKTQQSKINAQTNTENATRQGKVDKLQADINNTSNSNDIKKLIDTSFAVKEYNTTTDLMGKTQQTATGRKVLQSDEDKNRVVDLLVEKTLKIKNPATTGLAEIRNIEDVLATYGLDKLYETKLKATNK